MSDTKEHLERRIADSLACGKHLDAAEYITLLVQLVADEAANLDGKTICTYPVVPEGDVPEWLADYERNYIDGCDTKAIWEECQKYATRRVAEATADKDRRIAELESDLKHADNRNESRKRWTAQKERQIVEKDKRIAELEAECERLNILIQATAEAWLSLEPGVAWEGAIDAAMKAGVGEIQKLRQQLAVATRPVEDERSFFASDANGDVSEVVGVLQFRRERADRVAAEAERDELREAYKKFFPCRNHVGVYEGHRRYGDVPDIAIDAVLAAYRAEKGKVQACPTGG